MGPDQQPDERPTGGGARGHRERERSRRSFGDEHEEERYYQSLLDAGTHPQRVVARLMLGRILERRGQLEDAAEMYERNLWVGAHDPETFRRLAATYQRLGRGDLAEATLAQLRRQFGGRVSFTGDGDAPPVAPWRHGAAGLQQLSARAAALLDSLSATQLNPALGWAALVAIFALGAAFVFTLVSPALGSSRGRPESAATPPPPEAQAQAANPRAAPTQLQALDRATPNSGAPLALFSSAGLGASRDEWERLHGKPERGELFVEYQAGRFTVGFQDGQVWYLERVWGNRDAVPLETARGSGRELMPVDARLSRTLNPSPDQVLDVHTSETLVDRFRGPVWNGSKPGTFTVRYRLRTTDGHVTAMQFRLGDGGVQ